MLLLLLQPEEEIETILLLANVLWCLGIAMYLSCEKKTCDQLILQDTSFILRARECFLRKSIQHNCKYICKSMYYKNAFIV